MCIPIQRERKFCRLEFKKCIIERNYFGSDNGKSECDGEVGSLNRSVDMTIVGRKAIVSDAEDLYSWCMEHLCLDEPGSKRTFIHVQKGEIYRARDSTKCQNTAGVQETPPVFLIYHLVHTSYWLRNYHATV